MEGVRVREGGAVVDCWAITHFEARNMTRSYSNCFLLLPFTKQREPPEDNEPEGPDVVRLYDLSQMSGTPNRKWKWLLGMLSLRFAKRLQQRFEKPGAFGDVSGTAPGAG